MHVRSLSLALIALASAAACGGEDSSTAAERPPEASAERASDAHGEEEGHEHGEESLGTGRIGELDVELAQGHGGLVAGEEGHLVVRLPYSDEGSTVVRAWIGTEDRTLSYVGKGEYAPSHDDYDVHALAPDPLPEDSRWWIEVERPDGGTSVGSVAPLLE